MLFKIMDASHLDDDAVLEEDWGSSPYLQNMDFIESGLSSGEIRQSLLDRCKSEMRDEKTLVLINRSLRQLGVQLTPEHIESDSEISGLAEDIENILYDAEDEELINSPWIFSNEIIIVKEDE